LDYFKKLGKRFMGFVGFWRVIGLEDIGWVQKPPAGLGAAAGVGPKNALGSDGQG
jgi:hypothetical protein